MTIEEVNQRWEDAAKRPIVREMTFDGDCLVLGAQTRLAKAGEPLDEAQLAALLAAAHGRGSTRCSSGTSAAR